MTDENVPLGWAEPEPRTFKTTVRDLFCLILVVAAAIISIPFLLILKLFGY